MVFKKNPNKIEKKAKLNKGGVAIKKRKNKDHTRNFSVPIFKVLKEIHRDLGISRKTVAIMNSLVLDNFDKVLIEASNVMKKENKKTMSANDIQAAVKLVFPGELAKHANSEGAKAVSKYNSSKEAA